MRATFCPSRWSETLPLELLESPPKVTQLRTADAALEVSTRSAMRDSANELGAIMQAILLGIDGTGPLAEEEYAREMRNSFVKYIVRNSPATVKRYERGPAMDGLDMAIIAAKGYQFIHFNLAAHPKAPVFLTGYSRGGAGVISVAQQLARDNVKVSAMMLFDAVDRAIGIDSTTIPNNVERVVHAKRDPNAFTRNSFGNCGTRWHAPTRCDVRCFRGTHGAIGGCPWPIPRGGKSNDYIKEFGEATPTLITYGQDKLAAQEVWRWVNPRLAVHGFFGAPPSATGSSVS